MVITFFSWRQHLIERRWYSLLLARRVYQIQVVISIAVSLFLSVRICYPTFWTCSSTKSCCLSFSWSHRERSLSEAAPSTLRAPTRYILSAAVLRLWSAHPHHRYTQTHHHLRLRTPNQDSPPTIRIHQLRQPLPLPNQTIMSRLQSLHEASW